MNLKNDFNDLYMVSFKDSYYREGSNALEELERFLNISDLANIVFKVKMNITGKTLIEQGYKQGKELGELLLQKRIEGFIKERKEYENRCLS